MADPEKKPKIEVPDILLFVGLGWFFIGLGFAVSWPWALAITGLVMIGLSVWLVEPRNSPKVKPNAE
jgi:fatty acid desaturase